MKEDWEERRELERRKGRKEGQREQEIKGEEIRITKKEV